MNYGITDLVSSAMSEFSFGPDVYLRTITVVGGNAALKVKGTESITDILITPRPAIRRTDTPNEKAIGNIKLVGEFTAIILYGNISKADVDNANGLFIDSRYYEFLKQESSQLFLDSNESSGVEIKCVYRGA